MATEINIVIKRQPRSLTQTTNHILMIEPVSFGFNAQTSRSNHLQCTTSGAQPKALLEFQTMVALLREYGVHVITFKDKLLPHTPDSIFPNNVVTFHSNGKAFLYPMFAHNRRNEIDHDILHRIKSKGFLLKEIYDMRPVADSKKYLEGASSMVFDRINRIAYACRSERTDEIWFKKTCKRLGYEPIIFTANQSVTWKRLPIYHTEMMMTMGEEFVIICLESIDNEDEEKMLVDSFSDTGKELIIISEKQMRKFAGNMLQVRINATDANETALVMSTTAYNSLTTEQIERIESHCLIIHTDVSVIEKNSGGSVGSMMSEIFLPKRMPVKAPVKPKKM